MNKPSFLFLALTVTMCTAEKNNKNLPGTFVVETCLMTGKKYASKFKDTQDLTVYLATLLNAIALKFMDMVIPQIKFQLNEVKITPDEYFIGSQICGKDINPLNTETACGVHAMETLNRTAEYVNECITGHCDVVVLVTEVDLVREVDGMISTGVMGVASMAGICTEKNVAIGEDQPHTYSGVYSISHELAHLLGAAHDGDMSPLAGYTGEQNCASNDGYMMSLSGTGDNMNHFSHCSKEQMQYHISTVTESCYNVSEPATYANPFYPGENMTDAEFCKIMHPEIEDVEPDDRGGADRAKCKIHCCWKAVVGLQADEGARGDTIVIDNIDWGDYEDYATIDPKECHEHNMLDEMTCDDKKTCMNGVCKENNWETIKNYHQTFRTFDTISTTELQTE